MKKICLSLVVIMFCGQGYAAEFKTTAEDQKSVAITVYNQNLGLVKDVRQVKLKPETCELKFMDVASSIRPVTVAVKSLSDAAKFSVLEQNYEYDLLNPQKLMDKYVGKKIKLVEKNYYTGEEKVFSAELLSNNSGPIYMINNEIHVNTPGSVIFPEIPEDLIAKPTLVWLVDNKNPKEQEIEVSYLTDGINWKCDYIAVVNSDNARADLSGWVTIDNRSGAAYKNAKLKLVAGDVNRVSDNFSGAPRAMAKEMMLDEAGSDFAEEAFFEYHLYTLQRPSTIKNNQTKQIELLSAQDISIRERLIYYGAQYYFRNQYNGEMNSKEKVSVFLEVENSAKNKLGMPLPAGVIRAYKKDKEESLQFIGEDRIDHTPRDEKIKIKMGEAFDVVAKRKQTDYRILSRNAGQRFDTEQEWEIALSNHKDHPVEVEVVEPVGGEWNIVSATHDPQKTDSSTIKFLVKIEANKTQVVKYRVRVRYY